MVKRFGTYLALGTLLVAGVAVWIWSDKPAGPAGRVRDDLASPEFAQVPHAGPLPPIQVVEAALGEDLAVRLFRGTDELSGSDWLSAEFGEMEGGTYHAPDEMPPMGMDYVRILDGSGTYLGFVAIQFVPAGGYVEPSAVVVHEPSEGYETSTASEEILAPTDREPCPSTAIPGVTGVEAPVNLPEDPDDALVAQTSPQEVAFVISTSGRTKGKKESMFPAPTGRGLDGSTKVVSGPWKVYRMAQPTDVMHKLKSGGFGVTLNFMKMTVVKVRHRDHFRRANGAWVCTRSEKLSQVGIFAYGFNPPSYVHPQLGKVVTRTSMGFDRDGHIFDTPVVCKSTNPARAGI